MFSCESVTFGLAINMCSVRGEPGNAAASEGQTNGDRNPRAGQGRIVGCQRKIKEDQTTRSSVRLKECIPTRGMYIYRNERTAIVLSAGAAKSAQRSLHDRTQLARSPILSLSLSPSTVPPSCPGCSFS